MKIPPIDIRHIAERFEELSDEIVEAWEDGLDQHGHKESPTLIRHAGRQLTDILCSTIEQGKELEQMPSVGENDLEALSNYGLQLLSEMAEWADRVGLQDHASELNLLCFPFAVWMVRQGSEISSLGPPVNALAHLANHLTEPERLHYLYQLVEELMTGIAPSISQDKERHNPGRPWRILLLNRAIVATRTLQPELMEPAFDSVVEYLPEDAGDFFEQAMEQMDIVNYPTHVRDVVESYYRVHRTPHTLH